MNIFPYMFSFFLKCVGCKIFLFRGKRCRRFCSYSWSLLVIVCVCMCVCVCVLFLIWCYLYYILLKFLSTSLLFFSSHSNYLFSFFFSLFLFIYRDVMETYKEKASQLFDTLMDDVRRNAVYSLFIYKPAPNTQP